MMETLTAAHKWRFSEEEMAEMAGMVRRGRGENQDHRGQRETKESLESMGVWGYQENKERGDCQVSRELLEYLAPGDQ